DPRRTSPYRFYQFFMQAEDADVATLLRVLTFLSRDEIAALEEDLRANPGARAAQKALARELTTLVHGETACADAMRASEIMFGGALDGVSEAVFADVVGEIPTTEVARAELEAGLALPDALVRAGLISSKGQARKDIDAGGAYLNNVRAQDPARRLGPADLLFGRYILLRKGKRTYALLCVV
ncbi:MAG TPA: S4 domain-containing protein, partial [Ramlibacter sp.]|nr:S4 domain-containing protein [Ramlibacter sp.]